MSTNALAQGSLNSFPGLSAGQVPPEEQIFVLTSAQLEALISRAVARATAPLEARLEVLEEGVRCRKGEEPRRPKPQEEERSPPEAREPQISPWEVVQDLQARNEALKRELEDLQETTARERAYDRQRIAKLERVDPQPLQRDRGEILRALIAANGGKMLAKEARRKMHLSESRFSELLTTLKDQIEIKPFHLRKNQNVLILI